MCNNLIRMCLMSELIPSQEDIPRSVVIGHVMTLDCVLTSFVRTYVSQTLPNTFLHRCCMSSTNKATSLICRFFVSLNQGCARFLIGGPCNQLKNPAGPHQKFSFSINATNEKFLTMQNTNCGTF